MGLRVNNNIAALNAYRNLAVTDGQMSKSLEKLSSGFRSRPPICERRPSEMARPAA